MSNELTSFETQRLAELESEVEKGQAGFIRSGEALREIRTEKLYRQEYESWEKYLRRRWGISRAHAGRLMKAAEVTAQIVKQLSVASEKGNILVTSRMLPATESQARAIGEAPESERAEVWAQIVADAPKVDGKPQITTERIRTAVASRNGNGSNGHAGKGQAAKPKKSKPAKAKPAKAREPESKTGKPEWDAFNADLIECVQSLKSATEKLARLLKSSAAEQKNKSELSHWITWLGSIGPLRAAIRHIERGAIAKADDKAPGYLSVGIIEDRKK